MGISVVNRPATTAVRTVLVQRSATAPLVLEPRRRRDAVLARVFSHWLDPRLAAGVPPESGHLLAARATQLVDPRGRRSLAAAWEGVVARATEPSRPGDPRIPVARGAVTSAAAEISALSAALRGTSPVGAQEIAQAAALLTDGRSPVYAGGPGLREALARLVGDLTLTGGHD